MAEKFTKFDIVNHLKTEEDIVSFFNCCMEDYGDDPAFITRALGDIARAKGMTKLSRDTGISRRGLYKALSSDGNPEFSTIIKVMNALGIQLRATMHNSG